MRYFSYNAVMSSKPRTIVLKYGGNAMTDEELKKKVLKNICALKEQGDRVVIVHGGGPFIKQALHDAGIVSEFIDGHRKTTLDAFEHVEMALKGKVNGSLVAIINAFGHKAVGLSGKDAQTVLASKRAHFSEKDGVRTEVDLGQVGDVKTVDTKLIELLLDNGMMPVLTCIAADEQGNGYNINGDMFAGHLAGALNADMYVVLTDVDGLRKDPKDPATIMHRIRTEQLDELYRTGVIQGGMIPKMESCEVALNNGARAARIINGTDPDQLLRMNEEKNLGTTIIS